MQTSPLDIKHGGTTSSVERHHRHFIEYMVRLRRSWHTIIEFRQHTRSNNIERGRPSLLLDNIHRVGLRRALHAIITHGLHTWSDDVGHGNAIIALGQRTRSEDVGCKMSSLTLDIIYSLTK